MKESLLLNIFIHASFFLVIAGLVIPLLKKLTVPTVLGYFVAGIALGPQGLGAFTQEYSILKYITLQESTHVDILSELGVVFLLFVVGLELTPQKLWRMRSIVFGLGSAQVVLSACIIGAIAYLWGNSIYAAILLGLGLSLSSTAIITQWLYEKKIFNTESGQTSFGILLFQDLAVIPILLLISVFASNMDGGIASYVSQILFKIFLSVLTIIIVSKYLIRPMFAFSNKYGGSEVFVALSFLVIATCSIIAGLSGLSMALGAFIGGLILADSQYSHEISSLIVPIKTILLGIFFMSFGMAIDLNFIAQKPIWLGLSVIGLIMIKASIIYLCCRLWGTSHSTAAESALMLPQAGEFGLLVVGSAITYNILSQDVGQFMFLTVALTMMLTPFLTIVSRQVSTFLTNQETEKTSKSKQAIPQDISNHVIVLGYGRMGQTVSELLAEQGIKILGFDKNADILRQALEKGSSVFYGDVTKSTTLKSAKIDSASLVIVTIDNPEDVSKTIHNIKTLNKNVPLIVRSHKLSDLEIFKDQKDISIVPEYLSASQIMTQKALEYLGYSSEDLQQATRSVAL